jgi:hypothetical protein
MHGGIRVQKHGTKLLSIGQIAALAGYFLAMHNLLIALEDCEVSRESIDSTLGSIR